MITFMIMEIVSFMVTLLFFLLIINIVLKFFFISYYIKFKKKNKSIVIWIVSITLLLIALRIPAMISYKSSH